MKKPIVIIIVFFACIIAKAQYKITSVDKQDDAIFELLWIQQLENETLVYATLTKGPTEKYDWYRIGRKTAAYVNGKRYKISNSVNIPIIDDADEKWLKMPPEASTINFILSFEKFDPKDGFDIIESETEHGHKWLNFYGIHFEEVAAEEFVDTESFLDRYTVTTWGKYADNGKEFFYYIRDNVFITCHGAKHGNDQLYYVDIVNNSDHGIKFDWEKVWVDGVKSKNGTDTPEGIAKYDPDSYDRFLAQEDYDEARYAVGSTMHDLNHLLKHEYYTAEDSWAKLGFNTLASITQKAEENSIREYMANHPKDRPKAMKSQSIKAGESYHGYIANKRKNKYDYYALYIQIDGYDFEFKWQ